MKKIFHLLLVAALIVSLSACGNNETPQNTQKPSVSSGNTQNSTTVNEPQTPSSQPQASDDLSKPQTSNTLDVDLTRLSSTMVYSEVYNMMVSPDKYIGKTVKMNGAFAYYEDPETKKQYFACIIADATACCSQGLEFILTGKHTYPNDYPEVGSEITVTGTFELYTENGFQYCRLADATLVS